MRMCRELRYLVVKPLPLRSARTVSFASRTMTAAESTSTGGIKSPASNRQGD